MEDLRGFEFDAEGRKAVVLGPSTTARGYVLVEITNEDGSKIRTTRVEAQVRRAKELGAC
jgi:hypothetical protein